MKSAIKTSVLLGIAALPLLVPTSGNGQIFKTKKDVEAQLRVDWLMLKQGTPHHPSERLQRYAQCIAYAIVDVIPREYQGLDWEVIVFDSPMRNASVTPEGKIAVFSGLLEVADTPNEFAAVIGHEVAHLTQNHVMERVRAMSGTTILSALGGAALPSEVPNPMQTSQTVAMVGLQLPYQRKQEGEADLVGMEFMARAGYDPRATIELWREMGGGSGRMGKSDWLSTHPEPQLRMDDMARNLAPSLVAYNAALDAGVRPRCTL